MADGDQDQKPTQDHIWGSPGDGLRLDTSTFDLKYGDPTQPTGYFIGGAGEKGARWATNDAASPGQSTRRG